MVVKINDKEYPIKLGLAAIDYLDKIYFIEASGVKLGQGVGFVANYLMQENPVSLFHFYKAGMITLPSKPSNDDLEAHIAETAEKNKLSALCKEALAELKKSPLTKQVALRVVRAIEKAEAPTEAAEA